MAFIFKFPDLGEGLSEGKLLEWYVTEGQTINENDPLAKVETDKVVADIPSPRGGKILRLHGKVDQVINVGDTFVEIDDGSGDTNQADEASAAESTEVVEPGFGVVGNIEVATGNDVMPAGKEGRNSAVNSSKKVKATPVARKLARDLRVDINQAQGTGPGGRVTKDDVQRLAASATRIEAPAASASQQSAQQMPVYSPRPVQQGGIEEQPLSQLRKTIAARMLAAKTTIPHATTFEEVEISRLVQLRNDQRERYAQMGIRLSYMPFIAKAIATALRRHPVLNCRLDLDGGKVVYHNYVNLGVAVDTPDGLIVPVIRGADQLSIRELALAIQDLAARARERRITLDELRGGTFSITNYGAIAGIYGAPIINAPESAILGVGRILDQAVVKDGEVVAGKVLPLSLAIDHRIIDGGDASRFLREVMQLLADPMSMFLD